MLFAVSDEFNPLQKIMIMSRDPKFRRTLDKLQFDKERLHKIVEKLENKEEMHVLNRRLVDDLSKINFKDEGVSLAVEFMILIVSNMETQKRIDVKSLIEELAKIIHHNIEFVEEFDTIIQAKEHQVVDLINQLNELKIAKEQETKRPKRRAFVANLLPNNKTSNTILWAGAFVILLVTLYNFDNSLLTLFKTIAKIIG